MLLTKYLTREVVKSQIAILFILLLIFCCQQLIKILSSAMKGNIPNDLILSLLGLGIPLMMQIILPLSLFLAILLTFGRFYAENEIVVMHACGIGKEVLYKSVLFLALITCGIAFLNVFFISPWAIQQQELIIKNASKNPKISSIATGQFVNFENNNFVLFIDSAEKTELHDIYMFQVNPTQNLRPSVMVADTGDMDILANGDQNLNLYNTKRFESDAALPDFKIVTFDKYQAYIYNKQVVADDNSSKKASLAELWASTNQGLKIEFIWRIDLILASIIMAFIAIPLSYVNSRQGRFAKIMPALLIYMIYFLSQSVLKSSNVGQQFAADSLMILVNIIFIIIAFAMNMQDSLTNLRLAMSFKKYKKEV